MPKRKEPEMTPAEQFKRFRETAKRHGLDETGSELEEAFKGLVPKNPSKSKNASEIRKKRSD
jgi:hypothetical protein